MNEPDNLVLRTWTKEAWTFVAERSVTIEVVAGELLGREGEPFTHFIFPHSGMVSLLSDSNGNRAVEMMSTGREGFVGLPLLTLGGPCDGDIKGLVSGTATFVPFHSLNEAFATYACVRESMLRYGRFLLQTLMQTVAGMRSHSAERRIAQWLLISSDKLQSATIPITHETLAGLLGLRRATVTTALAGFVGAGSLETGRGLVRIARREQLETDAGEHYRKWHAAFEELNKSLPVDFPSYP